MSNQRSRLQFVDNIRWAMIVLVIFHHSAVTYSHVGSWFYQDGDDPGLVPKVLMATFLAFNQAYFMGFLFLIAGYFAAGSFDRKGFAKFIRDRLVRLGIPSLFFMLVLYPLIVYWMLRDFYEPFRPSVWEAYPNFILSGQVLSASGPMWFALALMIFCIAYGLFRLSPAVRLRIAQKESYPRTPGHWHVVLLIMLMASASFAVRVYQPVGASVLNMQLCNFSQYIMLFSLGIVAYRCEWLERIPFAFGRRWLVLALTAGVVLWFVVLASGGAFQGHQPTTIFGGLHWQSFLNCLWESFVCAGMCLAVLVLFRDRIRVNQRLADFMSRNAFSAYLFHAPLLVAVTLALRVVAAPAVVKFLLAGAVTVPLTFLASEYLFRRVPVLRRVL